jgi:hypothetical protein
MAGRGDGSALDYFGGRAVLMLFLGKREWRTSAPALELFAAHKHLFDDVRAISSASRSMRRMRLGGCGP